ncbi:hypothetical protein CIB48_g184 [Xylaria polymorpha]|nr:hypothetical protein CIB48_g184 [Xylaria polymorpha]
MTFELSEIQVREYKLGHFLSALQLFSSAADLYLYFLHPPYDSFHLNSKPTSRVTTGSDTSLSARSQFTITSWSFKMTLRPQPMLPHEYSWDETEKITRAILTVIYTDWNIPFDDVKKMITFTSTFIALDDGLKPIPVFEGFWYPGMITAAYVIIPAPTPDPTRWKQCVIQLRLQGFEEFAFKFSHELSCTYSIYPPTHIWHEGFIWSFKSYTLLKSILQSRLNDVRMDMLSVTEEEKEANSVQWSFSTYAEGALELALANLDKELLTGRLET